MAHIRSYIDQDGQRVYVDDYNYIRNYLEDFDDDEQYEGDFDDDEEEQPLPQIPEHLLFKRPEQPVRLVDEYRRMAATPSSLLVSPPKNRATSSSSRNIWGSSSSNDYSSPPQEVTVSPREGFPIPTPYRRSLFADEEPDNQSSGESFDEYRGNLLSKLSPIPTVETGLTAQQEAARERRFDRIFDQVHGANNRNRIIRSPKELGVPNKSMTSSPTNLSSVNFQSSYIPLFNVNPNDSLAAQTYHLSQQIDEIVSLSPEAFRQLLKKRVVRSLNTKGLTDKSRELLDRDCQLLVEKIVPSNSRRESYPQLFLILLEFDIPVGKLDVVKMLRDEESALIIAVINKFGVEYFLREVERDIRQYKIDMGIGGRLDVSEVLLDKGFAPQVLIFNSLHFNNEMLLRLVIRKTGGLGSNARDFVRLAATKCSLEVLDLLIMFGADVTADNTRGTMNLFIAISHQPKRPQVAMRLIEMGIVDNFDPQEYPKVSPILQVIKAAADPVLLRALVPISDLGRSYSDMFSYEFSIPTYGIPNGVILRGTLKQILLQLQEHCTVEAGRALITRYLEIIE